MIHLSDEQLVELVEGEPSEVGHLETCSACRERLDALRQMMDLLREDPVPEPSPLFWEHFSERVRSAIDDESKSGESIDDESQSRAWWTRPRWGWTLAGVAGVLMAALVVVTIQRANRGEVVADRSSPSAPLSSGDAAEDLGWAAVPADDSWAMVAGLAEGLDLESAADAGIVVRPGSIEQALLRLSEEERRDLARIIQAELDRSAL